MIYLPVALAAEKAFTWGDKASIAGTTTLLGMVTIFAVLALLWVCIEVMHFLLHRGEKKPDQAVKKTASADGDDAAIAAAIAAALAAAEDDGATVAAITAAITAMREEEGSTGAFRVVSFKRVGRANGRRR